MNGLLEKPVESPPQSTPGMRFHALVASAVLIILLVGVVGCKLTSIRLDNPSGHAVALLVMLAMLAPLPLYWHEKGRIALRESCLVIAWELIVAIALPAAVLVAARLRMPLQDSLFAHLDHALGVSVPGISEWASNHLLGTVLNDSYDLLLPLLAVAALIPQFAGQVKQSREFLLSNIVAFGVGIPAFALFPAIGPWYYYHSVPNPAQMGCQLRLLALRLPGSYAQASQSAGVICFPSFHVIWAVLSLAALWRFRILRIPVALLSAMIIMSTLTTGWHYFGDVLAGILLAVFSLVVARVYAV